MHLCATAWRVILLLIIGFSKHGCDDYTDESFLERFVFGCNSNLVQK